MAKAFCLQKITEIKYDWNIYIYTDDIQKTDELVLYIVCDIHHTTRVHAFANSLHRYVQLNISWIRRTRNTAKII